jgi:2-methylcitrate dehydratase
VFVAPAAAAGAGLLYGLSVEQMADALAIAVTANVATRQTRAGELSMWKGCATAAAAKAGLFAAQLAKAGMTGADRRLRRPPRRVRAGDGPFEMDDLTQTGPFAIERTNFKFFAAEYHAQAPLAIALGLRERVRADDIEALDVHTYATAHSEIGSERPSGIRVPARRPITASPNARGGPRGRAADSGQLRAQALSRSEPETTMSRIRVAEDPELTRRFPAELVSRIEVTTRSGQRFSERAEYPRGIRRTR